MKQKLKATAALTDCVSYVSVTSVRVLFAAGGICSSISLCATICARAHLCTVYVLKYTLKSFLRNLNLMLVYYILNEVSSN